MEGRYTRQPHLPLYSPKLQSDDGDCGKITIAEVEELVPAGELDANEIHTPGIFVQRVVKATSYEKPIEQRTVRSRD